MHLSSIDYINCFGGLLFKLREDRKSGKYLNIYLCMPYPFIFCKSMGVISALLENCQGSSTGFAFKGV